MRRLLIWYGELTTQPRLWLRGGLLLAIPVGWLTVFLLLPCLVLAALGFAQRGEYGQIIWQVSLGNFRRLAGFDTLSLSEHYYLIILRRSFVVALVTTVLSIVLAYPLAFFVAARSPRTRYLWLALVIVPFCTNLVIRTYAWMLVLSKDMPPARLAAWLGLIPSDAGLYPGPGAVYIGMISSFLPFAVLPLYTSVERLDWSLVEAARDLYGNKLRVFSHAILPQTIPGLSVAIVLTFIPAMGVFLVPDLLGGGNYMLVGNLIQMQFGSSRDWPFGAAVSLVLMVLTLAGLFLLRRRGREVDPV
ncbi:MAG TPA: ABC transporter permease [Phycisphaerae bacterium]|nr:ABC transporter permease [Phycisphaerae bacterium]HOJ75923.1 ABC transporter permease [Phycisphaerae bacterium]HOM52301.1 ABC transporter permease [Phycisphaerae bacterium]HON65575.1 ABC transporter permease [Phycisphaerae bacterium]HOQ84625.1 ABC transporter permease [Phycisphaerae bacterium]